MTEATEKKEFNLSDTAKTIIESVEKMSVLELSELVKALEDKFGVVAAAPVAAVAAAPADAGSDDDGGSDSVSVILKSPGGNKIPVLKAVREATGLGLKEAKDLVDSAPKPVKEGITREEAEALKKALEEQGAEVEIK